MKTAREIAERHILLQPNIDEIEMDILRYLEYHFDGWRKSEAILKAKMLEGLLKIGSERGFDGAAWENLLNEKIKYLKEL